MHSGIVWSIGCLKLQWLTSIDQNLILKLSPFKQINLIYFFYNWQVLYGEERMTKRYFLMILILIVNLSFRLLWKFGQKKMTKLPKYGMTHIARCRGALDLHLNIEIFPIVNKSYKFQSISLHILMQVLINYIFIHTTS